MPLFAVMLYFAYGRNYFTNQQMLLIAAQVVIVLVLIPICIFYLLKLLGKVDTIMLKEISQRRVPLLIQAILLYILIKNSLTVTIAFELYFFFLGALASTILALLLAICNFKASLHMLGISAVTIFVIGLSIYNEQNALPIIAFFVILNGIVATSRLQMKAHTIREIVVGFVCGILPQLAIWNFWL